MSYTWATTSRGQDDDLPRDRHLPDCQIWTTNDKPCNCDQLKGAPPPELTTAQRLDLIDPRPEPWLQHGEAS